MVDVRYENVIRTKSYEYHVLFLCVKVIAKGHNTIGEGPMTTINYNYILTNV